MSIVDRSFKFNNMIKVAAIAVMAMLAGNHAGAQASYTLKECIEYGMANHPSLNVARNNVANAKQASVEAVAGYLPQVNVNGDFTNNLKLQTNIIPAGAFSPTETRVAFGNKYASTVTAQAEQAIYNQALITGLKANKPNKEIAVLNEAQTKQTIIYNIASSYYQVITIQKQLELLNGNKERIEKLLKISQLQAEAGVAKKVDVKQVQVNLNNVLAQISVAESNLEYAYNSLKNSMGLFNDEEVQLSDTARWLNYTPQITHMPDFRFKNTIDYQLQERQIQLYDLNAKSIRAGALPTLSAFARYGANGFGGDVEKVFNRQFDYSAIGLKLTWNLFSGFRRNAQYHQAIFQRDNAKLNLAINTAQLNLQYQNAVTSFNQAKSTLGTNKENVDLAIQVYENTSLQYKEGVGTLSDLLNAESAYRDAQNNYIQSLISYYLAQLDVERTNSTLEDYYSKL
mgnify:CR=1 FL=1